MDSRQGNEVKMQIRQEAALDHLIHFYEVNMMAFSSYSNTVWNRFNWITSLEVIIFGFYFTKLNSETAENPMMTITPYLGLVIAALWSLLGRADYHSIGRLRDKTKGLESEIIERFNGNTNKVSAHDDQRSRTLEVSQSRTLYLFPLLFIASWAGIIYFSDAFV